MWIAVVRHTEMAEELTVHWAAVSSTTQFVLRHSPTEAFWVDVMDELVTEFWKKDERRSHLEKSGARVSDMNLGLPSNRVRLVDRLVEAVGWL
jgi:hypothetical protein